MLHLKPSHLRAAAATTLAACALILPAVADAGTTSPGSLVKPCKSVTEGITYLRIGAIGMSVAGNLNCRQANAVGDTWMLRFKSREQIAGFKVGSVQYRCRIVPTLPRNMQCDGGGTRIQFSAPTGG
jgi:hypothetical protein